MIRLGLRFAAVGHVTNDLLASGPQPGGSVFYAALAARALGAEATAVTCCAADWTGRARLEAAGVTLQEAASPATTCFENLYVQGRRLDRLIVKATPLPFAPPAEAEVVLACPVIGELDDAALEVGEGVTLGAGLQGWLRAVEEGGRIAPRPLPGLDLFRRCDAVFVSEDDAGEGLGALLTAMRARVPRVVLTRGAAGSTLFEGGTAHEIEACAAREVDPTGAGDVFATAFLLALASGQPSLEAARFASRAAAVVVEAPGAQAVPRLAALLAKP